MYQKCVFKSAIIIQTGIIKGENRHKNSEQQQSNKSNGHDDNDNNKMGKTIRFTRLQFAHFNANRENENCARRCKGHHSQ